MSDLPKKARDFLAAAGYSESDPDCRELVALVNLGCQCAGVDPTIFPSKRALSAFNSRMRNQLAKLRKLVVTAKLAGVTDKHLGSVPLAAPGPNGRRPWGELFHDAVHGWRYVPPDKTYIGQHATHRLAVISCLQSAIWTADIAGRKSRSRRRHPILQK